MKLASLLFVATIATPAAAWGDPEIAHLDATLAPGRIVRVAVRGIAGAHGTLAIGARPPIEAPLSLPLPAEADAISIRTVEVSGGAVVHVRSGAAGVAEEALVALRGGRPAVVWSGVTGLRGDPGGRTGKALGFEDLTGDGRPEALLYDLSEPVRLCGDSSPAPLFPRAFDPGSGTLRPVLLNRLRGSRAPETVVSATWQSPGPPGRPLVSMATFTSASSIQGDGEDPMRLAPPLALGDADLGTAWAEGRGGDGRGEFVTASLSGGYGVRAVGVVISSPGTPAEARRHGRPRSLAIVFGDRRFRATIPDDPADRAGHTLWIVLPEALAAPCMSLVLGESFTAASGPTRIAEVLVYSDLDFGGGIDRLVEDLARPGALGEDAARLLAGTGPAGAAALGRALPGLEGRARFLGARALADLRDLATVPALEVLMGDGDERVRTEAVRAFIGLGDPAVPALARLLGDGRAPARAAAAMALGRIGSTPALEALIAKAGEGDAELRRSVRDAISRSVALSGGLPLLTNALLGSGLEGTNREIELLRSLDLGNAEQRAVAARAVEALATRPLEFDERLRVLGIMGRLCETETRFASALGRAAASPASSAREEILRAEAVSALGHCGLAGAGVLREAIGDRAPRVRAAAIEALTRAHDRGAAAKVARVARQDAWAFLRSSALESLPILAPEAAPAAVTAALGDRSTEVRRHGIRMATRLGLRTAAAAIAGRADDPNEEAEVRTDAVYALGLLCARRHVGVIKKIARMGHRPDATDLELGAAGAAIESLARIGGTVAEEELRAARRPSSPAALRHAAERARRLPRCEPP
ncbi:MAG: HEAT repeat domain-containing protein [Deltaproteobacteria bacterium]|nr:HEAT repeat domain-containing protein [Deltaproteobacteria bacterium]